MYRYSVSPKRRQCIVSSSRMNGLPYVEPSRGLTVFCVIIIRNLGNLCACCSSGNDH
jgi:hypothetical protein